MHALMLADRTHSALRRAESRHTAGARRRRHPLLLLVGVTDIPAVLADLPPRILAQFDSDWTASRHRRPKCSKADFAAGWRTAMERNWWKGRVRKPGVPDSGAEAVTPADDDADNQGPEPDHTA